jgi:hypothetical protein
MSPSELVVPYFPTISTTSFVTLCFTKQKNSTENKIIDHAHSDQIGVKALICRDLYLCQHQSPPTTLLCTVYTNHTLPTNASSVQLTADLCWSATFLFPITGFPHAKISAGALRAGCAMALFSAQVDNNIIKLVGRTHTYLY